MEAGFIAIIILVVIRVLAGLNIPIISTVLRWWWNIGLKIAAYIPFCGWMSRFIITKGDERAEAEKAHYVNVGRETDKATGEMVERAAARAKAEQEADRARRAQEEANRKELEENLRGRAYREWGTRDVHLNSDGSKVRIGDGDYMSIKEFEDSLS